MIAINGLTKKFGKFTAVDGVSFEVQDNACFALLGLNGAGKTTLLNMLSTQILPSAGTATINGFDVVTDVEEVRKIINISPQENAIAKNLTVKENFELIASLYGVKDATQKIDNIINEFNLKEKENVICKKLSGGQMRRVSLALAILSDPKVLFLDEPTLGLDIKSRKILWAEIEKLKSKMTIILTTHYLEEVESLADEIGIISRGKLKVCGTLDEIKKASGRDTLEQAFLSLTEENV